MEQLKQALNTLASGAASFLMKIVAAIVVLIIGRFLIKRLAKRFENGKLLSKVEPGVKTFIMSFVRIILYTVLFFTVAGIVGIPTASLIALISSAGLAIGLALQGGLSNLAGGLLIMIFKPFRVGDFISVDGIDGTVSDINLFYTVLKTVDNRKVTIPNSNVTNKNVTTVNDFEKRRIDQKFLTSYRDDPEKVKKVILDEVCKNELVLKDPSPNVFLSSHEASGLEYTLLIWTATKDFWNVKFELCEAVMRAFSENGISVPYQTIDVNIKKED